MSFSKTLVAYGGVVVALSSCGRRALADFRFTITADPQGNMAGFGGVLWMGSDPNGTTGLGVGT